jgi:hypothetical protein
MYSKIAHRGPIAVLEDASVDELAFQGGKEALAHRIIEVIGNRWVAITACDRNGCRSQELRIGATAPRTAPYPYEYSPEPSKGDHPGMPARQRCDRHLVTTRICRPSGPELSFSGMAFESSNSSPPPTEGFMNTRYLVS